MSRMRWSIRGQELLGGLPCGHFAQATGIEVLTRDIRDAEREGREPDPMTVAAYARARWYRFKGKQRILDFIAEKLRREEEQRARGAP